MFFHEDLNLYKNKEFRSYFFLEEIWKLIETDLLYVIGLIKDGNITIIIDPGICYITVTSNFIQIFDKKYEINFQHSLIYCDEFSIEIDICIISSLKHFLIKEEKCAFYVQKNKFEDEGIVEYSSIVNLNINNFINFKESMFLKLCKELQYSINKNIFYLDIHDFDSIKSEIDAEYEFVKTYSKIKNISLEKSLSILYFQNKIIKNNKDLITQIIKKLKK